MTKAIQKITLSPSRDIPFNKLVLSQSNVRRVKAGISIEQLAESVAQRTLLQSLSVRAVIDADGNETGVFEVPAGGRRYRALELLVKQKRVAKTQPVPCVVRDQGIAEDDSLAENDERVGQRNHPMALKDALDHLSDGRAVLLHNVRSGYAAVQVPAPSLMRDDGEVEQRVRLIRPLERQTLSLKMMAESYWVEADRERFTAGWLTEPAAVPEFKSSTIYLVTGLLLPIWKRLPNESTRVYRLQTDTGERIIGRKVSPAWVAAATEAGTSNLTPDAAFTALLDGKVIVDLTETLQLRRVRVMGADRIELTGFTETMRGRLRAYGLFSEIISWKLRFFVPVDATGPAILAKVLKRYPVVRVVDRTVA